jgi:hypothetical protein
MSTGTGFREAPVAGTSTSSFEDPQRGAFSRDYESDIPTQIEINFNKSRQEKTSHSMMRNKKGFSK